MIIVRLYRNTNVNHPLELPVGHSAFRQELFTAPHHDVPRRCASNDFFLKFMLVKWENVVRLIVLFLTEFARSSWAF